MLAYLVNLIFLVGGLYAIGLFIEIVRALIRKTPARDIYESLFTKKYALIICLIK